jgi:uncharacterized membrane protein
MTTHSMTAMQDLVEVDALNVGGIMLWALTHVWFPDSIPETITFVVGTLVGLSLLALNVTKLYYAIKKGATNTKSNATPAGDD